MFAMQYECGYMPAHDEYSHGNANDHCTYHIHVTEIFRSKEKRIGTESTHEASIDSRAKDKPEYQQYLEFPEVQHYQLHWK